MFLLHHDHHGTRMHSAASWTSAMVCMRCPPHRKWCCDEMIRGLILDSVCRGRPTTHWFHHKTWTNAGSGFLFQQKNWCNDFYSSPFYSSLDIHSSYHRFFSLQVPSADTQEIPGTCWLTIQVLLQMNLPLELGYKFVTKGRLISEVLESGGKLGRLGLVTWRWSLSLYIYNYIYIIYIIYIYIYTISVCVFREARSKDCNLSRTNRRRSSKDNPMDKTKMVDGYATFGENWPLTKTPWDGCKKQQTFCGSVPEVLDIATYVLFL